MITMVHSIIPPFMAERVAAYKENSKDAQHLYNPAAPEVKNAIAAASRTTEKIHTILHVDEYHPDDTELEEALAEAATLKDHGLLVRSSAKRRAAMK